MARAPDETTLVTRHVVTVRINRDVSLSMSEAEHESVSDSIDSLADVIKSVIQRDLENNLGFCLLEDQLHVEVREA